MSESRIVTGAMRERVGRALELIPPRVLERAGGLPAIFEGDIRFAGLSSVDPTWAWCHYSARATWISLPTPRASDGWPFVSTVLHELGHFIHWEALRRSVRYRRKVYWSPSGQEVRVRWGYTGRIPPLLWSIADHGDRLDEAIADAFAAWLDPSDRVQAARFYNARPGGPVDEWGHRLDNRHLLAFFNAMAGLPADTPPVALRDNRR